MVYLTYIYRSCKNTNITTAKHLYKYLMRECNKLPKDAIQYYRHTVKQSFNQHALETDSERIRQIIQRALEDAEWIKKKYSQSAPKA